MIVFRLKRGQRTPTFKAVLFTTTKTRKQPRLSTGGHTNDPNVVKMYSGTSLALKRKRIPTHATTRTNPEDIVQSDAGQSQKDKYRRIPLT